MAYTTINKPSEYFNTKLYTGNGSTQSITGVGFQPDMCWWKMRSGVEDHALGDAVRGATKIVKPNDTNAEATSSSYFTSFDSDGFTLGSDSKTNNNSSTYASWNWKANGAGVSNTDGSITSTVSANTTSGFSIVKYTGDGSGASATIGHGLGVTPACVIMKPLNYGGAWWIAHKTMPTNYLLEFNNNPQANILTSFGGGGLSFSAFTNNVIGGIANTSADLWNKSSEPYIAYCFAEKKGFSKFGSYIGNGSTNGVFCYTGMKPAWVLVKKTSATDNWILLDNKRDIAPNPHKLALFPNLADAEAGDYLIDFLSNGFKIRSATGSLNTGSGSYIYMAFAENPLVGTNNIPATAR
jgi:hypothetical protein